MRCAARALAAARRSGVPLAGCSGGCFFRAAPRGVLAAARRGEGSLAGCSGGRFFRAAPRGVLRWRGARGALRPLFLLRSCAADQEKRPEKKSRAVMACALVRLERLWGTCIRSAPRCISRWQRAEGIFWLRGKEILGRSVGGGFVEAVLCGGALSVCCPGNRFLRFTPRGDYVGAGLAGRCGRFSCFAHAPLIKKSGQKRNHGLLLLALPSGWSVSGARASAALRAVSVGGQREEGIFWLRGKDFGDGFWALGLWSLCCAVRLCRFVAPKAASSALRRAGCCVGAGPAGRCGRFSCFAHAPLIKKSGQKRNHGLLQPALPSGWSA